MAKKDIETEENASEKDKETNPKKASKESKPKKSTKKKEAKSSTKSKPKSEESKEVSESSTDNKKEKSPDKFLKEFDWHNYEEGIEKVDEKKLKDFDKLVKENFVETLTNEVVEGTVVHISERDAIIDINAKSEGVISLNEFRYNPNLAVGDKVEVLIDIREDASGQLILSHRKARVIQAWDRVNAAHDTGEVVNGFVKCRTKGGMIVDVFGIEAFLPGSQIDVKPIRDMINLLIKLWSLK